MSTPEVVPIFRSLPTVDGVTDLVRRRYGLDITECVLVRTFVNEVYEVRTPQGRFAFKLYHHGGWSAEEIAWEGELVDHLVSKGIPVAKVVPLLSGGQVGEVTPPEGPRPFLLSEWVEGRKPQAPFADALYHEYGGLIAKLHDAGDTFRTSRFRRSFGLEQTLDEPLSRVRSALTDQPESLKLIEHLAVVARRRLTQLDREGMDRGIRHGDVTLDNVHITEAGLVIHDFDIAHIGWRIADLSSCLSTPFADAFRAGYTEVRAIGEADVAALPWLHVVESIGNLAFHLTEKTSWRGTESLGEGWVKDGLADLRKSAEQLL